jgi:hypothetical protein
MPTQKIKPKSQKPGKNKQKPKSEQVRYTISVGIFAHIGQPILPFDRYQKNIGTKNKNIDKSPDV